MINGFAGEQIFSNLIKLTPKIKRFQIPSSIELIKIASSSRLGRQRIKAAQPYLLSEFGINYRLQKSNKLTVIIDWECVPNTVILDYIFGIDVVVNILGYVVAIDVTANPQEIENKQQKLARLEPLWQQVGIDKACVCYLTSSTTPNLWNALKAVITQPQVIAISL